MINKIKFIITMIIFTWFVMVILLIISGEFVRLNISIFTTILFMGPLAGSGVLALIVSEIADKKREGKNKAERIIQ